MAQKRTRAPWTSRTKEEMILKMSGSGFKGDVFQDQPPNLSGAEFRQNPRPLLLGKLIQLFFPSSTIFVLL